MLEVGSNSDQRESICQQCCNILGVGVYADSHMGCPPHFTQEHTSMPPPKNTLTTTTTTKTTSQTYTPKVQIIGHGPHPPTFVCIGWVFFMFTQFQCFHLLFHHFVLLLVLKELLCLHHHLHHIWQLSNGVPTFL